MHTHIERNVRINIAASVRTHNTQTRSLWYKHRRRRSKISVRVDVNPILYTFSSITDARHVDRNTLWISPSVLTAWLTTHTFYLHFHHPQCSIDSWESQYRTTLTPLSYFYIARYLREKNVKFLKKNNAFERDCGGPDWNVKDIVAVEMEP